jgi:hypothetical protein
MDKEEGKSLSSFLILLVYGPASVRVGRGVKLDKSPIKSSVRAMLASREIFCHFVYVYLT